MHVADVLVVGAGPAGLAAAAAAGQAGLKVLVLDENTQPGGQYLRPYQVPPPASARHTAMLRQRLLSSLGSSHVHLISGATVWGALPGQVVTAEVGGQAELVRWHRLIIATGAYERTIPFPGWLLPGVATMGGAHALFKAGGLPEGQRVLVAGTGPFLYRAACELAMAGVHVLGVLEAARPSTIMRRALPFWPGWGRITETLSYLRGLRSRSVPVHFGHAVVAARGNGRVREAVVSRVDAAWHPVAGSEETLACDAVCIGYGFTPSIELPQLLGCELHFHRRRGGWLPRCDGDGLTSVAGVYVAGEAAGIGGGEAALAEGCIAGIAAARSLGAVGNTEAERLAAPHRTSAGRARAFSDALAAAFAIQPGLLASLAGETPICRCEQATAGSVRATISPWAEDLRAVRAVVRPGMGLCQGRVCGPTLVDLISQATNRAPESFAPPSVRMPLRPVSVNLLAQLPESVV